MTHCIAILQGLLDSAAGELAQGDYATAGSTLDSLSRAAMDARAEVLASPLAPQPVDFMAKFDEDRRNAAALMTDDELRRVKAELDDIVERNCGYETYSRVASCDSAQDDLVFIEAEIARRGALLGIVATQP